MTMKIEPQYLKFSKRFFYQIKESTILFFIIIIVLGLLYNIEIWRLILFLLMPIYFIFIIQSFVNNKYCLKKFYFNEKEKKIEIEIYRFDQIEKTYTIPLNELEVDLHRIIYSLLPWYALHIYNSNGKIFVQKQNSMWSLADFKKIMRIVSRIKKNTNGSVGVG